MYPLADYLLHIDADELATNMHFAEHLAQHINDRLLHAHNANGATLASAGSDDAPPSRAPSLLSSSASASATAATSSSSASSLSAPLRLPSLLSSTGSRELTTGDGSGATETTLPLLSDAEYNAMLDELISSTTLADAVIVEGPALQQMEDEEDEQQEQEQEKQQQQQVDEEQTGRSGSTRDSEERKEAPRDENKDEHGGDAMDAASEEKEDRSDDDMDDVQATPRQVTVVGVGVGVEQSERSTSQSAPPKRRQPLNTHITHRPLTRTKPPHASSSLTRVISCVCVCVCAIASLCRAEPSIQRLRPLASPPPAPSANHSTPRKTLAQIIRPLAAQHNTPTSHQHSATRQPPPPAAAEVADTVPSAAPSVVAASVADVAVLQALSDTALEELLKRIHPHEQ